MYYLYSTNDKPGAKLIRWGGRDKCSHFAKYYPEKGVVVESRIDTGVRVITLKEWLKENRIVFCQKLHLKWTKEADLYELDRRIIGKKYDKKAILWLSFKTILRKLFAWSPFVENKWGDKDHYFCLEIVNTHRKVLAEYGFIIDYDIENMYPEEFYEIAQGYDFITDYDKDLLA
jgi:hypothetical protein